MSKSRKYSHNQILSFAWDIKRVGDSAHIYAYPPQDQALCIATCPTIEAAEAIVGARQAAEVMTNYAGLLERLKEQFENSSELEALIHYQKKHGIEPPCKHSRKF